MKLTFSFLAAIVTPDVSVQQPAITTLILDCSQSISFPVAYRLFGPGKPAEVAFHIQTSTKMMIKVFENALNEKKSRTDWYSACCYRFCQHQRPAAGNHHLDARLMYFFFIIAHPTTVPENLQETQLLLKTLPIHS